MFKNIFTVFEMDCYEKKNGICYITHKYTHNVRLYMLENSERDRLTNGRTNEWTYREREIER